MASNTPRIDGLERNLIINGNMDFWQRGTSFSVNNASTYTADRFAAHTGAATTVVASRSTDVPTVAQSGFNSQYSLLLTNGTGTAASSTTLAGIPYSVEGFDYQNIHTKTVRLQFWAKSSLTGIYSVWLRNFDGSRGYVATYTINSANTWQRVSLDIDLDNTGTWNFDNTVGLYIEFNVSLNTDITTGTLNTWGNSVGRMPASRLIGALLLAPPSE